jgi:hypothetical protein
MGRCSGLAPLGVSLLRMSAIGTKRTSPSALSAFGGKADMTIDRRLERKPFPAYIALIFGLFGEVVQHFNDFIFQRAKKHSLHHQIDFGILGVFSVNANTKKRPFQPENDRLYIDEFKFGCFGHIRHRPISRHSVGGA